MFKSKTWATIFRVTSLLLILTGVGLLIIILGGEMFSFKGQTAQNQEQTTQPLPAATVNPASPASAMVQQTAKSNEDATNSGLPQAAGFTYYVATNGADGNPGTLAAPWRTLQKAANQAAAGATVLVRGGIYAETVEFNVSGSAANGYITFENYPGEIPIVDGSNLVVTPDSGGLFTINNKSYLIIKGFELRNYRTTSAAVTPIGILVQGSGDHLELRNNRIHNIETSPAAAGAGGNAHGVAVYGTVAPQSIHDIILEGNAIYNLKLGSSEALVINGNVEQFSILNNQIHDNDNIGIDIIGFENVAPDSNYDQARNGLVRGNKVYNIDTITNPAYGGERSAGGIYVDGGRDVVIEQNDIFNNDIGIELASEHLGKNTSGITVRNNLIYNNLLVGISIGGYDTNRGGTVNCLIINNTFFRNNTLGTGPGEFGLQYHALNNIFKNNIVYGTNANSNLVNNASSQNTGNLLDYNYYFTATGSGSWVWTPPTVATSFATYKTQSGNDSHSSFSDPQFVDGTVPNLHVVATSGVINAGQNLAEVGSYDGFGQSRLLEGQVDIGAAETSYCTTAGTITKTLDDGSCGSLRLAANTAKSGQTLTITLAAGATINLSSPIRLSKGVRLTANTGCVANASLITIRGNGANSNNGLVFSGNNTVENLKIAGFSEQELVALQGGANKLICVRAAQS